MNRAEHRVWAATLGNFTCEICNQEKQKRSTAGREKMCPECRKLVYAEYGKLTSLAMRLAKIRCRRMT